jgi:hypothetical protein
MAMVRDALITSTIDGDVGDHWRSSSNRFPLALLSNFDKKILLTRTQLRNDIDKCVRPLGLEELREVLPRSLTEDQQPAFSIFLAAIAERKRDRPYCRMNHKVTLLMDRAQYGGNVVDVKDAEFNDRR